MVGLAGGILGDLGTVVDRRVTAHAVQAAFGMDVPRSAQVRLVVEVEAGGGEALIGEDLAGGERLPSVE